MSQGHIPNVSWVLKPLPFFQMSWVDELDKIGVMDDAGSQRLNHWL